MSDFIKEEKAEKSEEEKAEDDRKYAEFQSIILAMGIPACKIMLKSLIKKATETADDDLYSDTLSAKIDELSTIKDAGGMNITFFNSDTNKESFAYLVMNKCDKTHNINNQLDKIRRFIPDEKWPEILKYVSMLLYLCQSIYETTANACYQDIDNLNLPVETTELLKLQIDKVNNTLYLVEDWDIRIGCYIVLEDEITIVDDPNEINQFDDNSNNINEVANLSKVIEVIDISKDTDLK